MVGAGEDEQSWELALEKGVAVPPGHRSAPREKQRRARCSAHTPEGRSNANGGAVAPEVAHPRSRSRDAGEAG